MISAFTMVKDPDYWCFPYQEALRNWCDLFDEVVVVDGGSTDGSLEKIENISPKIKVIYMEWPWDFKQREFPNHYNFGYNACTGSWAFKMDIDWLIHETDFKMFRHKLEWEIDKPENIAVSLQKLSMFNRASYQHKGRQILGINKKYYGDKIAMGIVESEKKKCDWTNVILVKGRRDGIPYGEEIPKDNVIDLGISFYNYDSFFRPKDKCKKWINRAANAFYNETGYPLYGEKDGGGWAMWKNMMKWRLTRLHPHKLKVSAHPKHIQKRIEEMTPDMWGYNNWDLKL